MVGLIFDKDSGKEICGKHLLIDAWGIDLSHFDNEQQMEYIKLTLERAAIQTGATVLFSHGHCFDPVGCSTVSVLAESHITSHWFPLQEEGRLLSIDVYVCGECDPLKAIPVIEDAFNPESIDFNLIKRGIRDVVQYSSNG